MYLTKVNWEQFKIRNEHYTKSFEDLAITFLQEIWNI